MKSTSIMTDNSKRAGSLTFGTIFRNTVAAHRKSVALTDGQKEVSYGDLNDRTNRLAQALICLGVKAGDRVAVLSENRLEYIELEIAAAKIGAILACQNWRQVDEELKHCFDLVSAKAFFVSERYLETIQRVGTPKEPIVFGEQYEQLIANADTQEPPDEVDAEDGVIILYTSGTTGMPKAALISHRAMIARNIITQADLSLNPNGAFIAWAPLFHMASTDTVFGSLMNGGKVIVMDGLDVPELVKWTTREEIGHLTLMPGMIDLVIDEIKKTKAKPKKVSSIGYMADLVPRHQIAEITTLFQAPYLNSFGSTETGIAPASKGLIPIGVVPDNLAKTQNSFCQIRLVDADDNDVADGAPGELIIRSPSLFSGYWGAPETNAHDFRGGWFHMGDVFVRNDDQSLDFVDRRKYLIKSGGENIYPAEIENVLRASARISEAVVVRKPDEHWGEVPVAFVVRNDASLTDDDVIEICRDRIAKYKLPKQVIFVGDEDLPRSATGKIKRHELEDRVSPTEPS